MANLYDAHNALYAALDVLNQQISNLEDERSRYKMQVESLERQADELASAVAHLLKRNSLLASALCDLADGNYGCWEHIQADTGMPEDRCKEIYTLIQEELKKC